VEEVVYPVPEDEAAKYMLHRDGCAGQLAFLVYDSVRAPRWRQARGGWLQRRRAAPRSARLAAAQVKSALQAVAQLHNRVLEPSERSAGSRKASAGTLMWARQVSGEGLHMKKWRLIVRNLAFDVRARPRAEHPCLHPLPAFGARVPRRAAQGARAPTGSWPGQVEESQLQELFSPAGFVWELTIPRKPDGA